MAADRGVADAALGAAGKTPRLRGRRAADGEVEQEVRAVLGHERGVGLRAALDVVPPVAQPVNVGRRFHEEPRLQSPPGRGVAAFQIDVEMFHPHHARRQRPVSIRAEAHGVRQILDREPPRLHRVVAPEIHVRRVAHQARVRRERREVGKRARRRERDRRGGAGRAGARETFHLPGGEIAEQRVVVARIVAPAGDVPVRGQPHARPRAARAFRERHDEPGVVVAEQILPKQLRQPVAAIDHAARDRAAVDHRVVAAAAAVVAVVVFVDRVAGSPAHRRRGRRDRRRDRVLPFAPAPAGIEAIRHEAHLLVVILPHVGDEKPTGQRIEAHPPRIAIAD